MKLTEKVLQVLVGISGTMAAASLSPSLPQPTIYENKTVQALGSSLSLSGVYQVATYVPAAWDNIDIRANFQALLAMWVHP